jgi:hypothetical protein
MIDPTIKIKEKKNSFTCKIKISKEEIESYLSTPEGVAELKKDFLEAVANEFDSLVIDTVNDVNGQDEANQVAEILETVYICNEPMSVKEEEEKEEEVEQN